MAQRDHESQSQSPDLGASVQLENAETLEDLDDGDGLDAGYVPPDRPYGLDEDGVTGAGMREGDTLDQRLRREQGEEPVDPDRAGRITIAGQGTALETADALAGVDLGLDGGAASAEEAAVHEVTDTGGAPVETEPSVADAPALADPELAASLAADPAAVRAEEQARTDMRQADEPMGEPTDPDPGFDHDR
jgi:Family of unknown function (DUF5709)